MPKKTAHNQPHFRVGDAMVYPDRLIISINDEERAIEPRIMEVLIALAGAAQNNEVLSAVNLYIRAWIGRAHAEDNAADPHIDVMQAENPVHKAITHLRKVFDDDPKSPRYIETIRKRGYRLVARVVYQDHYRRVAVARKIWTTGSPYVGLNAFDSRHASVFLGRSRTTGELIEAVRRQIDQQRRLVLVVGASGCGKTSLVNAGAIPILTEKGGYDGLRALSVARCDLAGTRREDALPRLAAALMQWTLDMREILPPQPVETLAGTLRGQPESLSDTLEDAFRRHASRDMSALSHPHLLLVIDHAEAIVADPSFGSDDHAEIDRFLHQLCESKHVCVIVIVRGDFYLALAEALPGMTERKSGDGHVDVLAPRTGEIGDIIRIPAASAGLEFQQHPESKDYLDDVLLRAAVAQPDALPLLQHTLQMLYERRNACMQLCFDAYQEIGGLEGALAHHAEHVFTGLPDEIQPSLDQVLSRIVVMQPENDRVSARRIPRSMLDAHAVTLAEAFVQARLFVVEHENGDAHYRVAHEALLRQWPRAMDWICENRRILLARIRLQRAAARWVEEGRRDDHLLNAGAPLDEAITVRSQTQESLSLDEQALITRSFRQQSRLRRIRKSALALLSGMAVLSTTMAIVASSMRDAAEDMGARKTALSTFMIDEFSERLDPTGNLALIESISIRILSDCAQMSIQDATTDELINCSQASRKLGDVMLERGFGTASRMRLMQSRWLSDRAMQSAPNYTRSLFEAGRSAAWNGRLQHSLGVQVFTLIDWRNHATIAAQLRETRPLDAVYLMESSYAANNLGVLYRDMGFHEIAERQFQTSVDMKKAAIRSAADNSEWRFESIVSASFLARMQESGGRLDQAASHYDALIEALRDVLRKDPSAWEWERQLTSLLQFDASLSLHRGDMLRARLRANDAINRLERMTRSEPTNMAWRRFLAQAYLLAGEIERCDGNRRGANAWLRLALGTINHPMFTTTTSSRRIRAMASLRLALTDRPGDIHAAIDALRDVVDDNRRDPYAWLALVEGFVLSAEREHHRGYFTAAASNAENALQLLAAPPSGFDKDPIVLALESRARAVSGDLASRDMHGEYLAQIGFRHPEYLAMQTRREPRRQGFSAAAESASP